MYKRVTSFSRANYIMVSHRLQAVVAFLVAAQSAGLDSLLFTAGVLGPALALWRLLAAGLLAAGAGLAVPETRLEGEMGTDVGVRFLDLTHFLSS